MTAAPFAPVDAPAVDVVAGRYRVVRKLGAGAKGQVYEAVDEITGDTVAIKRIAFDGPTGTRDRELEKIRSELTALRRLRLPGVARMRDDGMADGTYFVVMDHVRGRPFLGPRRVAWAEIRPAVLHLLESLARVHLAGVVHRDLKPANVLLDDRGLPVLVDFGLARGEAVGPEAWNRAGTPRYVPPEQILGQACGPQADLYAVGVMLYEALTGGALPQTESGMKPVLRQRIQERPRPLDVVAPDLDATVAAVVTRMVARDPVDRFESALDVIEALGGPPPAVLGQGLADLLPADRPATADELRVLFMGPDLFLHRREDAADVLWMRTGGAPGRVAEELQAWIRAGLCHWQDGPDGHAVVDLDGAAVARLRTGLPLAVPFRVEGLAGEEEALLQLARRAWPDTHLALLARLSRRPEEAVRAVAERLVAADAAWWLPDGRLGLRPVVEDADSPAARRAQQQIADALPAGSAPRLRHLLRSGASPVQVLAGLHGVVDDALREGDHLRTVGLVAEGLRLAREAVRPDDEERLLVALAKDALNQERPAPLEGALYEIGRAYVRTPLVVQVEALLSAARHRFLKEPERCRAALEKVGAFGDEDLEIWRVATGLGPAFMSMDVNLAAAAVDQAEPWSRLGTPKRRAAWATWRGGLCYLEGDFVQAGELQEEAASVAVTEAQKLAALSNSAAAWLEAGQFGMAEKAAEAALRLARRARQGRVEARLYCVLRHSQHRRGVEVEPSLDAVLAAERIDRRLAGQVSIPEAGLAWRAGKLSECARLAEMGARHMRAVGFSGAAVLLEAASMAAGPAPSDVEFDLALAAVEAELNDEFAVQALGFLACARPDRRPVLLARVTERASGLSDHDRIIDLLSVDEALSLCDAGGRFPSSPATRGKDELR